MYLILVRLISRYFSISASTGFPHLQLTPDTNKKPRNQEIWQLMSSFSESDTLKMMSYGNL